MSDSIRIAITPPLSLKAHRTISIHQHISPWVFTRTQNKGWNSREPQVNHGPFDLCSAKRVFLQVRFQCFHLTNPRESRSIPWPLFAPIYFQFILFACEHVRTHTVRNDGGQREVHITGKPCDPTMFSTEFSRQELVQSDYSHSRSIIRNTDWARPFCSMEHY